MKLNQQELSFVAKIPQKEAKRMIQTVLKEDKIELTSEASVTELALLFPMMSSHDKRYDQRSLLSISLEMIHYKYKQYLRDEKVLDAGEWVGGLTIFNKVLTQTQKNHAKERIQANRK